MRPSAGSALTTCACVVALLLACLASAGRAAAQDEPAPGDDRDRGPHTLLVRDVPMKEALTRLVETTRIDLVYSADLVQGKRVFCAARRASAEALLRCVLDGSGVDFVRTSSGSYVLLAATRRAPAFGRLAGRVVDAETGEPLPDANVLLADAATGAATDDAGLFSFAPILPGLHRVVVTYVGYATQVDSVRIPPGGQQQVRLALTPRAIASEPLVVDGISQRLPSEGLGRGEAAFGSALTPGAQGTPDAARTASRITGVSTQEPLADLHIQGASSGAHATLLDGVPVRSPVSLGRFLSAFSPLALDRITVHKAGFGASEGSYLSGVVHTAHDLARPGVQYASTRVDPVSANGRVSTAVPFMHNNDAYGMVAGRRSVWGVVQAPGLDRLLDEWNTADPLLIPLWTGAQESEAPFQVAGRRSSVAFSDLHVAARLPLGAFHHLYVSGYRGDNRVGIDYAGAWAVEGAPDAPRADSARVVLTQDSYDWDNTAAQVRYEGLLSARTSITAQLWGSAHTSSYSYALASTLTALPVPSTVAEAERLLGPTAPREKGNEVAEAALRTEVRHSLGARNHITLGSEVRRFDNRMHVQNRFIGALRYSHTDWLLAGFAESTFSPGLRVTVTPGARVTYVPGRRTAYVEPRLALRYDRAATPVGGLAVRLAGGLYRQFVNQLDVTSAGPTAVVPSIRAWLYTDRSVAPPKAYHAATDVLITPSARWSAGFEAYYKDEPHLLHVDYATLVARQANGTVQAEPATQDAFMTAGEGWAAGATLRLRREGARVRTEASYGISTARLRIPGRFEGRAVEAPWSEPHRLAAGLGVELVPGVRTQIDWQSVWGRPWAFRRAYYDYLAVQPAEDAPTLDGVPYDLDDPAAQRLAPLHQLDVGLALEQKWKGAAVQMEVRVVNALDRHNVFDRNLTPTQSGVEQGERTLPGRHLTVGVGLRY